MGSPTKNLKKLVRQLKQTYKCVVNKEALKVQKLKTAKMLVLAAPTKELSSEELTTLHGYLNEGGSVIVMGDEGGDKKCRSNLNEFLAPYKIQLANNTVVRTSYYSYFHPKEALVTNGVLHEDFLRVLANEPRKPGKKVVVTTFGVEKDNEVEDHCLTGFNFVYPYGGSLLVDEPSVPLLSTGTVCYPSNVAVMAVHNHPAGGKVFVIGSWQLLNDNYIDKEENSKVIDFILKCVMENDFQADDELSIENFSKKKTVPNTEATSERLKCAIQESSDISMNFINRFDCNLYKLNFDLLPEALSLYPRLGLKKESLGLIPPIFETPMLGLTPAVFPPILVEMEPPKVHLFDLDDEFANQETKLAQLTNKSTNKDLEFYISEAGNILGLKDKVNTQNPKEVLLYVMNSIMRFKME